MTEDSAKRYEIYYQGTVQGVGFRYTTRRIAARFPVKGFVRNEPDGRVHLVVEGANGVIQGFLAAIQAELGHYILDAEDTIGPATGQYRTFDIRF